jgi:maleate cis-trans isomerase
LRKKGRQSSLRVAAPRFFRDLAEECLAAAQTGCATAEIISIRPVTVFDVNILRESTRRATRVMNVISPWYQLGYVIPHLYTDLDAYQFYRVAPEGMMLVTTGLNLKDYTLAAVEQELPSLWQRFELLASKKVNRISLSGVPVASALGREKMRQILAEGEARTGLTCDTDLEAHISTLHHFRARRIGLATRWPEPVNTALTRYLKEAGIEVIATRSRPRTLQQNKHASAADDHLLALELGRQVLREAPEAQALLMPGGLWYAIHAVPLLEAEFGKPVLLNILSTTWAALTAPGNHPLHRPDARWGKVLSSI